MAQFLQKAVQQAFERSLKQRVEKAYTPDQRIAEIYKILDEFQK